MESYEVISYKDDVVFNYTVSGDETVQQLSRELILVWEETLEKFLVEFKPAKPYKISSFKTEKEQKNFIAYLEHESDAIIDDVEEEISRKMKFSFDYTSPTYED